MLFLGIDVSKAKLHTCLRGDANGKQKTKVVANSPAGVMALIEWLTRQGVTLAEVRAALEATGVDHEIAAEALYAHGVTVSIVNPAQAKDFARGLAVRTKTDAVDADTLARFGALVRPAPWTPPPPDVRALQALLARQQALSEDLRRERNRMEAAQATSTPPAVLDSLTDRRTLLKQALAKLQQEIEHHLDGHPDLKADLQRLISIPAVGPHVSRQRLVLLRARAFQSAKQLAADLGLVPIARQSGTSVPGRPRLSKAGPGRVRAVL